MNAAILAELNSIITENTNKLIESQNIQRSDSIIKEQINVYINKLNSKVFPFIKNNISKYHKKNEENNRLKNEVLKLKKDCEMLDYVNDNIVKKYNLLVNDVKTLYDVTINLHDLCTELLNENFKLKQEANKVSEIEYLKTVNHDLFERFKVLQQRANIIDNIEKQKLAMRIKNIAEQKLKDQIAKMQEDHQKEIEELNESHKNDIDSLNDKHKTELNRLREKFDLIKKIKESREFEPSTSVENVNFQSQNDETVEVPKPFDQKSEEEKSEETKNDDKNDEKQEQTNENAEEDEEENKNEKDENEEDDVEEDEERDDE